MGRSEATPPLGVIVNNRLAFGPRPGDLEAFQALGADDTVRLERWLEAQLDPGSIPDPLAQSKVQQAGF